LIIVNLLVFIFYDIPNKNKLKEKGNHSIKNVVCILKEGVFTFLIAFLTMYLSNAAKYVIDFILTDDFQTIYGIIIMPATVVVLFAQYMIQPYIIVIKNNYEHGDNGKIKKIISKITLATTIFGIFCIVLGFLIGPQILSVVYGVNIDHYRNALAIILFGAVIYGLSITYSNILMAINKNKQQVIMFIFCSILITYLSYVLIKNSSLFGASLSYALSMIPLMVMLKFFINRCLTGGENNGNR
jgi:O-antigen/teichoic acid export membrane protein